MYKKWEVDKKIIDEKLLVWPCPGAPSKFWLSSNTYLATGPIYWDQWNITGQAVPSISVSLDNLQSNSRSQDSFLSWFLGRQPSGGLTVLSIWWTFCSGIIKFSKTNTQPELNLIKKFILIFLFAIDKTFEQYFPEFILPIRRPSVCIVSKTINTN